MLDILQPIIISVISLIVALTPTIIGWVKSIKAYRSAKTDAEKEKAQNDMMAMANSFIAAAESAFSGFDAVMKQQGSSAGAMKKENVITKLQAYALQSGYEFDAEFWSQKIDEIVKFTREVNSKK